MATEKSKVDEAVDEIDAALAVIAPRLEGFYDYRRLNLKAPTMAVVEAVIAAYERRYALLTEARQHNLDLIGDGHPALDVTEVQAAVYADLQENAESIELALSRFSASEVATGMTLTAGAPEPK